MLCDHCEAPATISMEIKLTRRSATMLAHVCDDHVQVMLETYGARILEHKAIIEAPSQQQAS